MIRRDYSLTGADGKRAQETGLASAQWYACDIPRARFKELTRRRNWPAVRDTFIWFAALLATGLLGYYAWGTWWAVPVFAVYGVLYASAADSRWHECGHRTAFKTVWMNDVVYQIASFMVLREPAVWRWNHTRHHTDTIIVGRDPGIAVHRPPNFLSIAMDFLNLKNGTKEFRNIIRHCFGSLGAEEKTYVPETEWNKVYWVARLYALIYAVVIAACIALHSILPAMFIGLPSFYGSWLWVTFSLTQHAGLAEDVLDHRLNCRTVYFNRIFRFIYSNMNYHLEHHMFPMVPYHSLPALHEQIKAEIPAPYYGLWGAYREIIPALLKQRKDPTYYVHRTPAGSASRVPPAAGMTAVGAPVMAGAEPLAAGRANYGTRLDRGL
jgi:fatty acid desaturase